MSAWHAMSSAQLRTRARRRLARDRPGPLGTGIVVEYETLTRWVVNRTVGLQREKTCRLVAQQRVTGLHQRRTARASDAAELVDGAKYALRFKKDGMRITGWKPVGGWTALQATVLICQTAAETQLRQLLDATPRPRLSAMPVPGGKPC